MGRSVKKIPPKLSVNSDHRFLYNSKFWKEELLKFNQLLRTHVLENSPDFEESLARLNLALTSTSNLEHHDFKGNQWSHPGSNMQKQNEYGPSAEVEFDSFVLALLHALTGHFSLGLALDDSLLKNAQNWNKLTSKLDSENRRKFHIRLLEIRKGAPPTTVDTRLRGLGLKMGNSIFEILDCFKQHFKVNFCLYFYVDGYLKRIKTANYGCYQRNVYLTKCSSSGAFSAIVYRRRLYQDSHSYLTAIANDILHFSEFWNHFNEFVIRKSSERTLSQELLPFYEELPKCSSIGAISKLITKVISLSDHQMLHPMDILAELMNDQYLDKVARRDILYLVRDNIEMQMNRAAQSQEARKLEEHLSLDQIYKDSKTNDNSLISEFKKHIEAEKNKIKKLRREIQSTQNSILAEREDTSREIEEIESRISQANGHVAWVQFRSHVFQSEIKNNDFFDFDLKAFKRKKPRLAEITDKIDEWFKIPSESNPDLMKYIEQNKSKDCEEILERLMHRQNVTISDTDDPKKPLEIFGHIISISRYLRTIRERKFSELRIIATEKLIVDASITVPGKNVLLCGDQVTVAKDSTINTSGLHAQEFGPEELDPEQPTASNLEGIDGNNGNDGMSAGNVAIISNHVIIGLQNLHVIANGGNGARGQNGGKGANGENGDDGEDGKIATPGITQVWSSLKVKASGDPGQPGKPGRAGGKKGLGGAAGSRGKIIIKSGDKDESKNCVVESEVGNTGKGGDVGEKGDLGHPGKNGSDHGFATESFYFWDSWVEAEGEFDFIKVNGWFKGGYKIDLKQTKDQVHQTYAENLQDSEENIGLNSTFYGNTETSRPNASANKEIDLLSRNVSYVLSKGKIDTSDLEEAEREKQDLVAQLISKSSNDEADNRFKKRNEEIFRKEQEEATSVLKAKQLKNSLPNLERRVDETKQKEIANAEKIKHYRATMEKLKRMREKFKEENRFVSEVQEQSDVKVCSEFPTPFEDATATNYSPAQCSTLTCDGDVTTKFSFNHAYFKEAEAIMVGLENKNKVIFEECLQKAIFYSTAVGVGIPMCFFKIVGDLSRLPQTGSQKTIRIGVYKFADFVSKILPGDLRVSLELGPNEISGFRGALRHVSYTILNQTNLKRGYVFEEIYSIRCLKIKGKQLEQIEAFTRKEKIPESLQNILQDTLEKNYLENFVDHLINPTVGWRQKQWNNLKRYYSSFSTSDTLKSSDEAHKNIGKLVLHEEDNKRDDDDEKFQEFEKEEIDQAKKVIQKESKSKGIISEEEIRHCAEVRLNLYREIVPFKPDLKLADCFDPKRVDNIAEIGGAEKIITDFTGLDPSLILQALRRLLASKSTASTEELVDQSKLFPLYALIISRFDLSLRTVSELYYRSLHIANTFGLGDNIKILTYQIYMDKFVRVKIDRLKNSTRHKEFLDRVERLEKQLESHYSGVKLDERMHFYENILNSEDNEISSSITAALNHSGKIGLCAHSSKLEKIGLEFNRTQNVDGFLQFCVRLATYFNNSTSNITHAKQQWLRDSVPQICLHLEQLPLSFEDLEMASRSLTRLQTFVDNGSFKNISIEFNNRVQVIAKTRLAAVRMKFDLNQDTKKQCDGILNLIIETLNATDDQNIEEIIQHFAVLVQRVYSKMIERGECSQIERLASKIEQLKLETLVTKELFSRLNITLVNFLQELEGPRAIFVTDPDAYNIFYKTLVAVVQNIPSDVASMTFEITRNCSSTLLRFTSEFLSYRCLESMERLLNAGKTANENPVIPIKICLNSKINELGSSSFHPALKPLKDFRDVVNCSTKDNFNKIMFKRFQEKRDDYVQICSFSMQFFCQTLTEILEVVTKPDISLNSDNLFKFLNSCFLQFESMDLLHLVSGSAVYGIAFDLINITLAPLVCQSPSTLQAGDVCDILFNLLNQFISSVLQSESGESKSETKQEKDKRYLIFKLFTTNFRTLYTELWKYPKSLHEFHRSLHLHHQQLSKQKSNKVHGTLNFIVDILDELIGQDILAYSSYEDLYHFANKVTDSRFEKLSLLLRIFMNAGYNGNTTTLDDDKIWKSAQAITALKRSDNFKLLRSELAKKEVNIKWISSFALSIPATKSERLFLMRVLRNARGPWTPSQIQMSQMKDYFTNGEKSFNQDFWRGLLKSDILEFLTFEENQILKQLSNFFPKSGDSFKEAKVQLSELLFAETDPSKWIYTIRDFARDRICEVLFPNWNFKTGEKENLARELQAIHFFIRSDTDEGDKAEERFFSIFQSICQIFAKCRSPGPNFMTKFIHYAQHIPLNSLQTIIKTKLPQNWLLAVLRVRLVTSVQEILANSPETKVCDCEIVKVMEDTLDLLEGEHLEKLITVFGDNTLRQCGDNIESGNSANVLQHFKDICECLKQAALTRDLVKELAGCGIISWKNCFRRNQLLKKGLSKDTVDIIIVIESKVLSSQVTDKFLHYFNSKFPLETSEDLLNRILAKVEGGEWFIEDEILNILSSDVLINEQFLLEEFSKAAIEKRGKDVAGEELIEKLCRDPINEPLKDVLKKKLLPNIKKIHLNLNGDYIFDNSITNKRLCDWDSNDIKKWSKRLKAEVKQKSRKDAFKYMMETERETDILSVICQAVKIHKTFTPWDTQIISVMIYLESSFNFSNIGRLGQISTGEGKTIITAMLAIFWALPPQVSVNVITSTHILATENQSEVAELFNMFGITLANNCDKGSKEGGDKERQTRNSQQVVYGDLSSFQSDILYTENLGKKLTKNRDANYVFVDEADNMLLDKGGHMLYISHPISEFRHLRPIFVRIWGIITTNHSTTEKGKFKHADVAKVAGIIRADLSEKKIRVPNFLQDFVNNRILTWVKNGFQAMAMSENDPYIVSHKEGRKVVIIDNNTGLQESSMQYSFGLHQFIELKHNDKLSCENLKAIFMSNFSYFKRYSDDGKLYGITGTLGSAKSREVMNKRYNVDFFCMERHKYRYCPQDEAILTTNKENWLNSIKNVILEKARTCSRAVLVIAKNVTDVKAIAESLARIMASYPELRLKTYEDSTDENFLKYIRDNEIPTGMVIVGTNLAGRGTDLKLSQDVINAGGLHVIFSYLPGNSRIAGQGLGRAGRKGDPGSTQFVLLVNEDDAKLGIEKLRRNCEDIENERLDQMDKKQLPLVEREEELFEKFRNYVKQLEKSQKLNSLLENVRILQIQFVRNRWALWLDSKAELIKLWHIYGKKSVLSKFEEFEKLTNNALENDALQKFPSEFVKLAKAYEEKGKLDKAIELLNTGAAIDPDFAEIPLYYKAYCLLKKDPNSKNNRLDSIQLLKNSQNIIRNTIAMYEKLPQELVEANAGAGLDAAGHNFLKQISGHCELLTKHSKTIDMAVGFSVNMNMFRQVAGVSEATEAQELFEATIKQPGLLKKLRVSKKVEVKDDKIWLSGEEINLCSSYSDSPINQSVLVGIISKSLNSETREIGVNSLKEVFTSKEEFWDILQNAGAFKGIDCDERHYISSSENQIKECKKIAKLRFFNQRIRNLAIPIGLALLEVRGQPYEAKLFDDFALSPMELQKVEAFCRMHGVFEHKKCYTGHLSEEFRNEIDFFMKKYPQPLQKFGFVLENYLQAEQYGVKESVTSDKIPFLLSKDLIHSQAVDLIQDLISFGVVREPKINISLRRDFEYINTKVAKIKETIDSKLNPMYTKIFNKYHSSQFTATDREDTKKQIATRKADHKELDLFLKSIKDTLLNSIGSLRRFGKVKADTSPLEENFSTSNYPHVIVEYIQNDFDRVLKLNETAAWWKSGGFIVTLLGLGQIVAGACLLFAAPNIGMGLLSEGLSDTYYGYSVGYTNPNFSTSDYLIQKSISVAASVVTCGLSFTGGLTLQRLGMEVGEELIKRTILFKAGRRIGGEILGIVINKCLNWTRDSIFRRFKDFFLSQLSRFPGYINQMQNLQYTLSQIYMNSRDTVQANKIIQDSMQFLFKEEDSVFMTALNNAAARIGPQLLGRVTSAITSAFGALGNAIFESFQSIMSFSLSTGLLKDVEEILKLAATSLERLNEHLQLKIDNLRSQRESRASLNLWDGMQVNTVDVIVVQTYQECIGQEIGQKILQKLQEKILEPAANEVAQFSLDRGMTKVFESKRAETQNLLSDNRSKIINKRRTTQEQREKTNTINQSLVPEQRQILSHIPHINLDTPVRNLNGESVRSLYELHGENLRIFQDKYGRYYGEL